MKKFAVLAMLADALLVTASGQIRDTKPLHVSITHGQQFAHPIQLPSEFRRTRQDTRELRWYEAAFEHYMFRLSSASPEVLLVAACRYENPSRLPNEVEICSENSFSIDTAHSFAVQEARKSDWVQGVPIEGFLELYDPHRRNPREEAKKPFLRAEPIGVDPEREGYSFRGKQYMRREQRFNALGFGASSDGKLIVLDGFDRSKLSHGSFTLDVFDADPTRRIVAIDAESPTWVAEYLGRVSIVNSRWMVVGLSLDLQKLLLFDFKNLEEHIK